MVKFKSPSFIFSVMTYEERMIEELYCIVVDPRIVHEKKEGKAILRYLEESERKPISYIGMFSYPMYPFTTDLLWKYPLRYVWVYNGDLYDELWEQTPADWDWDSGKQYPIEEIRKRYWSKPQKELKKEIQLNPREHGRIDISHIWYIGTIKNPVAFIS